MSISDILAASHSHERTLATSTVDAADAEAAAAAATATATADNGTATDGAAETDAAATDIRRFEGVKYSSSGVRSVVDEWVAALSRGGSRVSVSTVEMVPLGKGFRGRSIAVNKWSLEQTRKEADMLRRAKQQREEKAARPKLQHESACMYCRLPQGTLPAAVAAPLSAAGRRVAAAVIECRSCPRVTHHGCENPDVRLL